MRPLRNRGFTLVEMVVVLGLMGIVLGALYQSIVATQRTTSAQFQRIDVQQTTRAAAMYMSNMLRELDAALAPWREEWVRAKRAYNDGEPVKY